MSGFSFGESTVWVEGVHNLSEPGTRAEVDSPPAATIEVDWSPDQSYNVTWRTKDRGGEWQ